MTRAPVRHPRPAANDPGTRTAPPGCSLSQDFRGLELRRKLLIDPRSAIDTPFEVIEPEKLPSEEPRNVARRARHRMSPAEREADKARVRAEKSERAKARYAAHQATRITREGSAGLEDVLGLDPPEAPAEEGTAP